MATFPTVVLSPRSPASFKKAGCAFCKAAVGLPGSAGGRSALRETLRARPKRRRLVTCSAPWIWPRTELYWLTKLVNSLPLIKVVSVSYTHLTLPTILLV
mgnify:CR=1 FL=1